MYDNNNSVGNTNPNARNYDYQYYPQQNNNGYHYNMFNQNFNANNGPPYIPVDTNKSNPVDIESGRQTIDNFDIQVRHNFIRNTFSLVLLQLFVAFGIATTMKLTITNPTWYAQNFAIAIVSMLISTALICAISYFPRLGRKSPVNYIILFTITALMGTSLSFALPYVKNQIYFSAMGLTFAVTAVLVIFATQTKIDFTGFGIYAIVLSFVLLAFAILAAIIRNEILQYFYLSLGILVYSFYIIFDMQLIVGGKNRKYQFDPSDHVLASLNLFIDIFVLFQYILDLLNKTDNN